MLHGALSSGNFPVVWEPLQLTTAVLEPALTTLTLQPALEEQLRQLSLRHSVAPDVPAVLMGDATRLVQLLSNLLSNACKFSNAGGSIDLRVDVLDAAPPGATAQSARWLQLQVIDTGIGIDPDKLEHVFKPIVQADTTTVRQHGGTGLGLAVRSHLRRPACACPCDTHTRAPCCVLCTADLSPHRGRHGRRAHRAL